MKLESACGTKANGYHEAISHFNAIAYIHRCFTYFGIQVGNAIHWLFRLFVQVDH